MKPRGRGGGGRYKLQSTALYLFAIANSLSSHSLLSSYQHNLDLVNSVDRSEQRNHLHNHICMTQRCYYRQNWLHKHLETGIH